MRHERRLSETKRTPADIFLEAKRRFQFRPGPTRKPHVHDIIGNLTTLDPMLNDRKKSLSVKTEKKSLYK